jgi:hypothetical protein
MLNQTNTRIITGSITDVTSKNGRSIAENFLAVKAFVMVDVSSSMKDNDAGNGKTRWEVASNELEKLQNQLPGQVAVACFSTYAKFVPNGVIDAPSGGTNIAEALQLMKHADNSPIRLILISDGEPQDGDKGKLLARKFKSKIDTIYVGPEDGRGREYLRELSACTGGISLQQDVNKLNLLNQNIQLLLGA